MKQPLVDPLLPDTLSAANKKSAHSHWGVARCWRTPLIALISALCLNALLLLAIGDQGPLSGLRSYWMGDIGSGRALAAPRSASGQMATVTAVDRADSTLHLGFVITRPEGNVGMGVITDTSSASYDDDMDRSEWGFRL